jgi:hypothetical protein
VACTTPTSAPRETGGRIYSQDSWFDRARCAPGLKALRHYRTDYDETRRVFSPRPVHDWSSHAADAFRYGAVGFSAAELPRFEPPRPYEAEYLRGW